MSLLLIKMLYMFKTFVSLLSGHDSYVAFYFRVSGIYFNHILLVTGSQFLKELTKDRYRVANDSAYVFMQMHLLSTKRKLVSQRQIFNKIDAR